MKLIDPSKLIDPNKNDDRIGKDFKRNYPGMKCKEKGCNNIDLNIAFWGDYCVPCGSFYYNHIKNNSQACKNWIEKNGEEGLIEKFN